jgi:hypothetical protein
MNAEQARIASILARAVAQYIHDDQRADYPLPAPVEIVVKSKRVAQFVKSPYTTKDGSVSVTPLGDDRVRLIAHAFTRSGLWNGPDALPNDTLRGMLASLYHDLLWIHAAEFCNAWGCERTTDFLKWANDVLYLVWVWASNDSWWGRREAWLAFQAVSFAAPVYHKIKDKFAEATAIILACGLCAGCSGCFSVPDGEVESVDGVEVIQQVMHDYGNGLGPGPDEKAEE